MIQQLTNYVVMNSTGMSLFPGQRCRQRHSHCDVPILANVTIAAGARPVMSHETDLVPHAGAVLVNIGTLDDEWVSRFHAAAAAANAAHVPLVLDPVGAGATKLRTQTAVSLLTNHRVACVKGNAGEIGTLARDNSARVKGVDSDYVPENPADVVSRVARLYHTVAAMTGKVDIVSDGERIVEVHNNAAMLGSVTGTGCAVAAIIASTIGSSAGRESHFDAVVAGLTVYAIAAEYAEQELLAGDAPSRGPASFWNSVLDNLYSLQPEDIISSSRVCGRL